MMTRKTNIIGIVGLIYIAIASAVLFWVIYEVSTAGQALSQRVTAIADNNAKTKVYKDFLNVVEETKTQREALTRFVLTEEETSTFLTNIESMGSLQGVTLVTNSLKVVPQTGMFDLLVIQFSLEGSEASMMKMLTILETLPYHSVVSSLSLERKGDGSSGSTVGLEVSLLKHAQ